MRDAMRKRGTSRHPVSVCLSVTLMYCIETAKDITFLSASQPHRSIDRDQIDPSINQFLN